MDIQTDSNSVAIRKGAPLEGQQPLIYNGEPVLTTRLAAKAFDATPEQIGVNFERNKSRFERGKHFFKVEGAELRAVKDSPSFSGSVGSKAKSLVLWTERGIARHAKILETETAWYIFEELEDTYFRVREEKKAERVAAPATLSRNDKTAREARLCTDQSVRLARMAGLEGPHALQAAASRVRHLTGHDILADMGITFLAAPQDEKPLIPTQIGERLGEMSARAVNQMLVQHGFQTKDERGDWIPTQKGADAGGHMIMKERQHSEGVAYQLVWPTTIVDVLNGILSSGAH